MGKPSWSLIDHEKRHVRRANSFGKGRTAYVKYSDDGNSADFCVPEAQWRRMTPVERAASLLVPGAGSFDKRAAEAELRAVPRAERAAARREARRLGRRG